MFSRLLLITCICIVLALILYFFYWNRFVAFIIGHAIRILFWNQEGSSIWIEIGSIHFSIVAGRILLKDVRYYSSNQTMKIVKAQIQWRYWIRRPTSEDELNSAREVKHSVRLWSCRIQLTFEGVEWFLYNRTAAYDSIIEQLEKASQPTSHSSSHNRFFSRFSRQATASPFSPLAAPPRRVVAIPESITNIMAWLKSQLPTLDPKDLLPLGIDIQTGAIILGNPSTPNLLVAEFRNAVGTFGIVSSRSKYDLYKQVLNLKFQNSLIRFVHNDDYVDPMSTIGALVHSRIKQYSALRKPSFYQSYRNFLKLWRQNRFYDLVVEYFNSRQGQRVAASPLSTTFHKSKPMASEDTPLGIDFTTFEYAIERKILETPVLELTYYVDVVGEVPPRHVVPRYTNNGIHDIQNGDTAPEWGFDLVIYGGFLRYGPWADRQRAELQRAFFPPTYLDSSITPNLKPGEKRMWTALQVFVELRDETTLYIPFRETSKDWQWDGVVDIPQRPRTREEASIVISVGDRSSINYIMPMIVGPSGYESTLEVHLDAITVTSSLNDIRLISAESCRVRGELPAHLRWNAERTWTIAVSLRQPVLYLLRDHINMFTDLARDWVSGPPTEYQKFVPMIYKFSLDLHHYELNLYANDQNIVDKPLIRDENAIIALKGIYMKAIATIPSNKFQPESTAVPFTLTVPKLTASCFLPRWNTHALHPKKEGIKLFTTESFVLDGSYRWFSSVMDEHVEQLTMDFDIKKVVFNAYGWSIRYFMVLRDNYLGSFTHFQTLSEYLEKRRQDLPVGDPIALKYRPRKANMLQAVLSLRIENGRVLLPVGLIGDTCPLTSDISSTTTGIEAMDCVFLDTPEIQLRLRMHDFYMEMSLNVDRISASLQNGAQACFSSSSNRTHPKSILIIDGLDIVANRLFGPQPRTATYLCLWEISLGKIKASVSVEEATLLAAAGNSFRLNFTDLVNAPAIDFLPPDDPDVTFYKVKVSSIEAMMNTSNVATSVLLQEGVKFDSNDLGAHQYRRVTSLKIPHVCIRLLLAASLKRNTWLEAGKTDLDMFLDMYSSPIGHRNLTRKQMAFIEEQDRLTGRAKRMFNQLRQKSKNKPTSDRLSHVKGVFIPQPTLPDPAISIPNLQPQQSTFTRPRLQSSWRPSALANLSDSEGEEGVSEADRDARLARTRTSTPVLRSQEDDIMSSGDESDDADLSDGHSDGDDWSDSEENDAIISLLSFYAPLVKHYASSWGANRIAGDIPSFFLKKDGAAFTDNHLLSTEADKIFRHVTPSLPEGPPKDKNITTFRIKMHEPFSVLVTPLILPVVWGFEDAIKNLSMRPEMCIDSLLVRCHAQVTQKLSPSCQVLQLEVPLMTTKIIQHITELGNENSHFPKAMHPTSHPSNLDVTSIFEATLRGISVSCMFGVKTPMIKGRLNEAMFSLDTSVDKKTLSAKGPDSIAFELMLSELTCQFSKQCLSTDLGQFACRIGNRGPELIIATSTALTSAAKKILDSIINTKRHRVIALRMTLADILKASEKGPIIDSLSSIQPSYLVQRGLPQVFRTDVTFRFLYHLRNCIRAMQESDYLSVRSQLHRTSNFSDFLQQVESRLIALDQDADQFAQLTMMDPMLFESDEDLLPKPVRDGRHLLDAIILHMKSIMFVVLAPTGGTASKLTLDAFRLDVRSRSFDLVQFNITQMSSTSQTSLRSKTPKSLHKVALILSIGESDLTVTPHLMSFAQHVLRVKRYYGPNLRHNSRTFPREPLDKLSSKRLSIDMVGILHKLRIRAAAANLVVVLGINQLRTTSNLLLIGSDNSIQSMNHSILFEEIFAQARSPTNAAKDNDQDILAALTFAKGHLSAISRVEIGSGNSLKFVFALEDLRLDVPRSALRLYRFIGEWRADYLPGIEATMKALLSEYNAGPTKSRSPAPSRLSSRGPSVQIHGQITHFEIQLQVMHGTWLSWEVNKTIGYFDSSNAKTSGGAYAFGLQVASMFVSVSSKPNIRDILPSARIKLSLPALSIAGHSDGFLVDALVLFELIDLKIKPSHWDTLLSVQQKFGQDFNDLLALTQKTRQKQSRPARKTSTAIRSRLQYKAHLKMQGFRIGLEGASSVVLLECQDINGGISNIKDWSWDLGLSDLTLSLAPRMRGREGISSNRSHRSAFVTIDFKLNGSTSDKRTEKSFDLSISKMHAVMQPSSIGGLGDFVDNLQVDMLDRQEQRAIELAAFKEKARNILNTFDVNIGDVQLEETSWINNFIVKVIIRNIGVAFPLTHDEELLLPNPRGKESLPVQAFLFSIKSIDFETNKGESGQAVMHRLAFQFVSKFRQSVSEDFSAERHQTRNCLYYPQMKAQLRSSNLGTTRKLTINADVDGFVLDIDSTIPRYIFALIDVYREGKERVERLATTVPKTPFSAVTVLEASKRRINTDNTELPTLDIFADLFFHSGKVRLYSGSASSRSKGTPLPTSRFAELPDAQILNLGAEVFNLPVVTVSVEYRAKPASQKTLKSMENDPSTLIFNSTVHSSSNALRPSLLPFLTELVDHIEARMRKISSRATKPPLPFPVSSSTSFPALDEEAEPSSSLQVCFSLRIDQSKLEFTCQPDVNVVAGLHWESGGFVINMLPGAKKINFLGTVGGLTIGLKHGFLSEDCVKLDARNLTFSVTFQKMNSDFEDFVNSLSVVLDTEILGEVRFSRLQDILCFKAVWLDRIPLFNNQAGPEGQTPSRLVTDDSTDTVPKRELSTSILIRIRKIYLEIDLGQSITKINVELNESIFRTKLADDLKEVFVYVGDVSLKAQGNLSGSAQVPLCFFQTVRRSEAALRSGNSRSKMLELRMTSGALIANLMSDYQQLLHYRAEPLEVEIFDDWSHIQDSRPLQLSFTVTCSEIVAAVTVGTLPKLLSYMNKFKANLDAQRHGAYRESKAFRATRTPKPDNPLSAVAEAMIHSARSRFKEADSGLSYIIQQHMSLRLRLLRLVVFPRTMKDPEIAQFIGRDVQARLDSILGSDVGPPKRDLRLSFASMMISRYTQVTHSVSNEAMEGRDQAEWLTTMFRDATEAIIVGLPSMNMHMISEESTETTTTAVVLTYDFYSKFVRREGMEAFEDIYITLNVSLYAWLTLLRKNLTREMEQVRTTEDWRTSISTASTAIAAGPQKKRKAPEPLNLMSDNTRSSTLPSAGSTLLSPFGPSSARLRTPQSVSNHTHFPVTQSLSPALPFPSASASEVFEESLTSQSNSKRSMIIYKPRNRHIERLTMRQLGEATPDVMHPFFMKKAGFNLEDSLPQYVNEYAVVPLEEILDVLLKLYSQQLLAGSNKIRTPNPE